MSKTVLAVGVGCRKGCAAAALAALVREALDRAGPVTGGAALFTIAAKRGEPGIAGAAALLDLPLGFLPQESLAGAADRCSASSAAVEGRFGLPSVAETAALAGAGPGSRLVVPRFSAGGATCAVAISAGAGE